MLTQSFLEAFATPRPPESLESFQKRRNPKHGKPKGPEERDLGETSRVSVRSAPGVHTTTLLAYYSLILRSAFSSGSRGNYTRRRNVLITVGPKAR